MKRDYNILTTLWFLIGLTVLLLNDFVFKELYGNWLTGKLSDFSGLFIFPLFWTALLPRYKNKVFWLTGILFIYWKSSYSEAFIESWNGLELLTLSRVVDYTDLIALAILPLSYLFENYKDKALRLAISPAIPIIIASFSFIATSHHTNIEIHKTYQLDFTKGVLNDKLTQIDSLNYGHGVKLSNANPETIHIAIPYDFCFRRFDAKVTIAELSNDKTLVTLVHASHDCPEGDDDKENAIKAFEEVIIEQIKTMP